jgi:hypothetical protein
MLASSAGAVDLRLRSTLSESFEINDNRLMQPVSPGPSYNSISSLVFSADALAPTARLNVNTDLAYRAYAGPGEENSRNVLDRGATARFEKLQKLTTYNVSASWREFETAAVQLEETGIATLAGSTVSTSVGAGLRHQLNPRDTIAWQTTWSSTAPQGATTTESLTSNIDLVHRATALIDVNPSLSVQQLNYSGGAEVMFLLAKFGMFVRPIRRLSVRGSVGAAYVDADSGDTPTITPTGRLPAGGTELDWVADVVVSYELSRRMRLGLNAARTTGPNTFGEFSKTETVGASLFYEVNRESSVSFAGSFTEQTFSGGTPSELLAGSVGYSYRLAREWSARTSYRFTQRRSATTSAQSNAVLFAVTRDYVVLP